MRIIRKTNIDFMGKSNFAKIFSILIIILGAISLIMNNGPKLSIDFKGGTLIAVNYIGPVNINDVRTSMEKVDIEGQTFDFSKAEIKHFGDLSNVALRIASFENEPDNFTKYLTNKIEDLLNPGVI